jgi:hypothetical protein
VYGLLLAIGLAWPVQRIFYKHYTYDQCDPQDPTKSESWCRMAGDKSADRTTSWVLLLGLVGAVAIFLWLRRLVAKLDRTAREAAAQLPTAGQRSSMPGPTAA